MALDARTLARVVAKVKRDARRKGDGDERHEIEMVPLLDIVTNVMLFLLATIATVFTATLPVPAPDNRPGAQHEDRLTVSISASGYLVAANDGYLQPDCTHFGSFAVAVPALGGAADPHGLARCLRTLHAAPGMAARFPSARAVQVAGAGNVPYEDVVAVIDAMRGTHDGAHDLFPNVHLGVMQ